MSMWSRSNPRPIEGQRKPLNNKPLILPLTDHPQLLLRNWKIIVGRLPSNGADLIESQSLVVNHRHRDQAIYNGVVTPLQRQWITLRVIRQEGPITQAL
jgi:hypothetical protein